MVRARLPANPLFSVSGREPRAGSFEVWRPSGRLGSRSTPRKPFIFGFRARTAGREFRDSRPGGRHGSRSPSRKPFVFGFRARTSGREFRDSRPAGRVFQGAVCSLLPANPCGSVPGSKFFTQIPRRRPSPAGFSKARFAPRSPLTLAAPFRGANSSHKFRADARDRPAFPRRGLLPSPRKPLQFRSGEQILHINSAPTPETGRLFQGAVCSPLPANPLFSVSGREPWAGNFGIRGPPAGMVRAHLPASPLFSVSGREPQAGAGRLFQGAVCSPLSASPCSSVPGSKFFTQIPRRRPGPGGFSMARFAPRSPQTLAAPFRGANSSHKFRADARDRPAFPRRGLLSPPR